MSLDIKRHQPFRMALIGLALKEIDHIAELLDDFIYMLSAHFATRIISWTDDAPPQFELSIDTINYATPTILIKLFGTPKTSDDTEKIKGFLNNLNHYCAGTQGFKEFIAQMTQYGYTVDLKCTDLTRNLQYLWIHIICIN